jgi:hypothetical protein
MYYTSVKADRPSVNVDNKMFKHFDTTDALREHEESEQQDKELQNKGLKLALQWNLYKTGNKVQDELYMQYW